jgi:hypothetical protein
MMFDWKSISAEGAVNKDGDPCITLHAETADGGKFQTTITFFGWVSLRERSAEQVAPYFSAKLNNAFAHLEMMRQSKEKNNGLRKR